MLEAKETPQNSDSYRSYCLRRFGTEGTARNHSIEAPVQDKRSDEKNSESQIAFGKSIEICRKSLQATPHKHFSSKSSRNSKQGTNRGFIDHHVGKAHAARPISAGARTSISETSSKPKEKNSSKVSTLRELSSQRQRNCRMCASPCTVNQDLKGKLDDLEARLSALLKEKEERKEVIRQLEQRNTELSQELESCRRELSRGTRELSELQSQLEVSKCTREVTNKVLLGLTSQAAGMRAYEAQMENLANKYTLHDEAASKGFDCQVGQTSEICGQTVSEEAQEAILQAIASLLEGAVGISPRYADSTGFDEEFVYRAVTECHKTLEDTMKGEIAQQLCAMQQTIETQQDIIESLRSELDAKEFQGGTPEHSALHLPLHGRDGPLLGNKSQSLEPRAAKDVFRLNQKIRELEAALDERDIRIGDLSAEMASLEESKDRIEEQAFELRGSESALRLVVEEQLNGLRQRLQQRDEAIASMEKGQGELLSSHRDLQSRLQDCEKNAASFAALAGERETLLREQEENHAAEMEQIKQRSSKELAALQSKISDLKLQCNVSREETSEACAHRDRLATEVEALQVRLSLAQQKDARAGSPPESSPPAECMGPLRAESDKARELGQEGCHQPKRSLQQCTAVEDGDTWPVAGRNAAVGAGVSCASARFAREKEDLMLWVEQALAAQRSKAQAELRQQEVLMLSSSKGSVEEWAARMREAKAELEQAIEAVLLSRQGTERELIGLREERDALREAAARSGLLEEEAAKRELARAHSEAVDMRKAASLLQGAEQGLLDRERRMGREVSSLQLDLQEARDGAHAEGHRAQEMSAELREARRSLEALRAGALTRGDSLARCSASLSGAARRLGEHLEIPGSARLEEAEGLLRLARTASEAEGERCGALRAALQSAFQTTARLQRDVSEAEASEAAAQRRCGELSAELEASKEAGRLLSLRAKDLAAAKAAAEETAVALRRELRSWTRQLDTMTTSERDVRSECRDLRGLLHENLFL